MRDEYGPAQPLDATPVVVVHPLEYQVLLEDAIKSGHPERMRGIYPSTVSSDDSGAIIGAEQKDTASPD